MAFLLLVIIIAFIIYMFVRDNKIKKTDEYKKQISLGAKPRKFLLHRKWWIWVIILFLLVCVAGGIDSGDDDSDTASKPKTTKVAKKKKRNVSKSVNKKKNENSNSESSSQKSSSKQEIPTEYKNALETAKEYQETEPMSKAGLYEQLTSKDGDGFEAKAAQYAVDHLNVDWNENALKCAKDYQKSEHLSKSEIQDQLSSSTDDGGEGFTPSEVQYAMSHLN